MKLNDALPRPMFAAAFRVIVVVMALAAGAMAGGLGPPPESKLKRPERSETNRVTKLNQTPDGAHTIGLGQALVAHSGTTINPITDALVLLVMELRFEAMDNARVEAREKADMAQWKRHWYQPFAPGPRVAITNSPP